MNKSRKVVMLPTTKAAPICRFGTQLECGGFNDKKVNNNQHLYLTSDEEIKEGDWYYDSIEKRIIHAYDKEMANLISKIPTGRHKIIASTDSSLGLNVTYDGIDERMIPIHTPHFLPLIPGSFIKAYVEANGEIDEVMVEYEDNGSEEWSGNDEDGQPFWNEKTELKLRDNNTVIIHQAKTYTREELGNALERFRVYSYNHGVGTDELSKWINENL